MPQTVNITATGLCLFVPGEDGRMYVLMPATGPGAGDGSVPRHHVTLQYDAATVESGAAGPVVGADGRQLTFGLSGGAADPAFASGVVDLDRYTGTGVPAANLAGDGGGAVAARAVFPSGAMRTAGTHSCWTMTRAVDGSDVDERVEMTNAVVWTATLDDGAGPLVIRAAGLGGGGEEALVAFRTDLATLDLTLSYDVDHAHGGAPAVGEPNLHFEAYRWLFGEDAAWHLPRFAGEGGCGGGGGVLAHGGMPSTCLVAGGGPG
jgi:hypothetical protein